MPVPWLPPPPRLRLSPGELYVFRLQTRDGPAPQALSALLDAAEQARAARFLSDSHRRRFQWARGWLRAVLGRLLDADPATLAVQVHPDGKPFLPGSDVRFNLSHSHDLALLAVTLGREVGVDVERIRPGVDTDALAARFFAAEEVRDLMALPVEARPLGFYLGWTRKEAYIKARGLGLKIPLHQFAVTLTPGMPARLVHPEPGAPARWSMVALEPGPGYVGAAVVEGPAPALFCWESPFE